MILLAEVLNRNEFDTGFLGQFVQVTLLLSALGMGSLITWAVSKRKPSMDVELGTMATRLKAVEADVDQIRVSLQSGADIHRQLQSQQAINSTRLEDVQRELHQLNQRVGQMPQQIADLLKSFKPK